MQSHVRRLRSIAVALVIGLAIQGLAISAHAKPVTMNDITIDLPSSFTAAAYSRGIETKTPDEEVFVWFETYLQGEADTLIAEHTKYWKENDVTHTSAPTEKSSKNNDINVTTLDFKDATWKGKPTVLRYLEIGPLGAKDEMVLVTVWASPEGINEHTAEVHKMIDSMDVKIKN